MARAALLIGFLSLGFTTAAEDACKMKVGEHFYNLKPLQTGAMNPHRFYDGPQLYKINFCGAPACSAMGATPTPGCQQAAASQGGVGETTIGTYSPMMQTADINMNDIMDINFKTKNSPTFAGDTKGVKVYYPPTGQGQMQPGQSGQPGQPGQFGQQNGGQFGQQTGPQQPASPWGGNPSPPAGGWPNTGRRLQQQGFGQQSQQQSQGFGQQPQPGQQQPGPGYAPLPASDKSMTVFVLCNAEMVGNARPIIFAPGMEYKTREGGLMFVMEHSAGCVVEENFIERATGGLAWGWTFLICLAIFLVIYCGCGIFYKTKKLGVTGIEAIPNIEFWRDYPSIVKEGCGYSLATLLNCVGKGNGGYSAV